MELQPSGSLRLQQLQRWLASGWRIEEPVLHRSAYHGRAGRVCAFEIVVCDDGKRQVITLWDEPEVQQFLMQQQLMVIDIA